MAFVIGNFDAKFLPADVKTAIGEDVPMYGIKFDGVNSAGIRTYDAATLNWTRSSNTVRGTDDFADLAPFNVKECITQYNSGTGKREVLAYKGDSNWASLVSAKTGDRMIEVPCFWYYRPSKWEIIIAPKAKVGFKPSPMHYRNGTLYEKVRITKYALNSSFVSQTGFSPLVSTNMNTFRNNLRAKGMYLMDYDTWCSLVMLMVTKYANLDVQNTVGRGRESGNATIASGNADNVLGLDGSATDISTNESCLTLGIENFFSNVWKYVDGLYSYGGTLYWKDVESMSGDPANYSELLSSYTPIATNVVASASNASISDIAFDSGFDWMQFPTATGSPSPTGDACWANTNFNCVVVGGGAWTGSSGGLFCFGVDGSVGCVSVGIGALGIEF